MSDVGMGWLILPKKEKRVLSYCKITIEKHHYREIIPNFAPEI
jgi:hypothetical protein